MALQIDSVSAEARTRRGWLRESAQDEDIAPGSPRRISIFGLGYVGAVSLACLARDGHEMFGVEFVDAACATKPWDFRICGVFGGLKKLLTAPQGTAA